MNEESRGWLEAAKILVKDPNARVLCPSCRTVLLRTIDYPSPIDPTMFDRQLLCEGCGASEFIVRMRSRSEHGST